jgi:hypothetical protein
MSLTLHLGVLVMPYDTRKKRVVTTGYVAEKLEERYGVMQKFFDVDNKFVIGQLENSLEGALESMLMGRSIPPFAAANSAIEARFRDFIASKRAEQVGIPGTPTQAALMGVNHRRKHPYSRKNPRRPSFRDTGLYMTCFRAWVG